MPPEIRSHEAVVDPLARGLALARHFNGARITEWPQGIDPLAASSEATDKSVKVYGIGKDNSYNESFAEKTLRGSIDELGDKIVAEFGAESK